MVPAIIEKFIAPISKIVIVEPQYRGHFEVGKNVQIDNLGIGRNTVWHGNPDARAIFDGLVMALL